MASTPNWRPFRDFVASASRDFVASAFRRKKEGERASHFRLKAEATRLSLCALLIAAAIGSITGFRAQAPADSPAALKPTGGRGLTEVPGIKVGSHTLTERLTGC